MFRRRREEAQEPHVDLSEEPLEPQIGLAALRGSRESFDRVIDGLNPELDEFEREWTAAQELANEFLSDPETREIFNETVKQYHKQRNVESIVRAQHARITESDLEFFVSVHIMLARMDVAKSDQLRDRVEEGAHVLKLIGDYKNDFKRVHSKWITIDASADASIPAGRTFFESLVNLQEALKPRYKRAHKASHRVAKSLDKYIDSNPIHALEFLRSCDELADSDDPRHLTLMRMIAVHHTMHGEHSIVTRALDLLRNSGETPTMVPEFLIRKLRENEGDNPVEFARRLFESYHKGRSTFLDYMSSHREEWPTEWKRDYQDFVGTQVAGYKLRLEQALRSAKDLVQHLLPPTFYEIESELDRLARKVGLEMEKKARPSQFDHDQRTKRSHRAFLPPTTEQRPEVRGKRRLEYVSLVRGEHGWIYGDSETVDQRITELAERHRDEPRYKEELRELIRRLTEQPFDRGTTSLNGKVVSIGEHRKKKRVYRFNPNESAGFSKGDTMRESRVVFTVADRKVAIICMTDNHKEYERIVKNL